jgi:hypothetical protein
MAQISNSMLPNGAIVEYICGELCGPLSYLGVYGYVCGDDCLLEVLEAARLCMCPPDALFQCAFGNCGSFVIDHLPHV